ncbi:MAG: hypothetical protein DRQ49_04150 [Gammaproteobacteria bacterium]|nr:MAG: hypothetical protein DRQ49_04150 [Gammaproteobacteria bacterium]RKZ74184.1 MAG: hypothetical protein DRQ57_11960 [Gammaproteobacteria bacterium]
MEMLKIIFLSLILLVIALKLIQLLSRKSEQLKQFEKNTQKKREELQTTFSTKNKELGVKTKELAQNLRVLEQNSKKEKKNLKKQISNERKIGRNQAGLFWLFIFSLYSVFLNDIKDFFKLTYPTIFETTMVQEKNAQSNKMYRLTVNPVPSNSTIKIMNIKQKYTKEIPLEPGQYVIKVEHPDYSSRYQCVIIKDEALSIEVPL